MKRIIVCFLLFGWLAVQAQKGKVIYDEEKVPAFVLPPLLVDENGNKITSTRVWEEECRPKILNTFAKQMDGITPDAWAMSRAVDYFETDPQIDMSKIVLMGHSRIGKAA